MTRSIGSVFKYNGCAYVVVESRSDKWGDSCNECVLDVCNCTNLAGVFGECESTLRRDKKEVHFEHFGVNW